MKIDKQKEKKLVFDILKGKESALRQFYSLYKNPLSFYITKKVGVPTDAEEVLQDTLLASLDALRDFSFRSSLFTYLCSIASHKVIDYYRKKKIRNVVFSHIPEIEDFLGVLESPEDVLDKALLKDKIVRTYGLLSPLYRQILKMKYEEGYSVVEISKKLAISFKSTESHLFRARKAFTLLFKK